MLLDRLEGTPWYYRAPVEELREAGTIPMPAGERDCVVYEVEDSAAEKEEQ